MQPLKPAQSSVHADVASQLTVQLAKLSQVTLHVDPRWQRIGAAFEIPLTSIVQSAPSLHVTSALATLTESEQPVPAPEQLILHSPLQSKSHMQPPPHVQVAHAPVPHIGPASCPAS